MDPGVWRGHSPVRDSWVKIREENSGPRGTGCGRSYAHDDGRSFLMAAISLAPSSRARRPSPTGQRWSPSPEAVPRSPGNGELTAVKARVLQGEGIPESSPEGMWVPS